MSYKLENVSRYYENKNKKKFFALKEITITFPNRGLICLSGPSGSGKSTLLNLLATIDKPSSGVIHYKNSYINRLKGKKLERYRNNEIGLVFQYYHLLDDESVLYNIALPDLIHGSRKKVAYLKAKSLLNSIGFNENLYNSKVKDLSGGEKQRVAILRALIRDPEIILADEPTGALDSSNSIMIMNLLKKLSKTKLVIVVSHNKELVNEYADQIIYLKDGSLDKIVNQNEIEPYIAKTKRRKTTKFRNWYELHAIKNLINRKGKNIFSIISLTTGLLSTFLVVGFSNGYKQGAIEAAHKQLDYGTMTVYKETVSQVVNGKFSLVKNTRLNEMEISAIINKLDNAVVEINPSYLFPISMPIYFNNNIIDGISFVPIYDFNSNFVDLNLVKKGTVPQKENEIMVNASAERYLKDKYGIQIINNNLDIKIKKEVKFNHNKDDKASIYDYFLYEKKINVTGVVEDFSFLSMPKIYYSINKLNNELRLMKAEIISKAIGRDFFWYDFISQASGSDPASSYCHLLFLNCNSFKNISNLSKSKDGNVRYLSQAYLRESSFCDLMYASTIGMDIFLGVALIGVFLIIGIISYSSYSEDKKKIAIFYSIGANKNDISLLYSIENIIVGICAFVISVLLFFPVSKLTNILLFSTIHIKQIISLPRNIFLPFILLVLTIIIVYFASSIPIDFSTGINLKEELKDD